MNNQFKNKEVKKIYWAIIEKKPNKESGYLENYLVKNQKLNKSYITTIKQGKFASLYYKVIKKLNNYTLLEINPNTGRHHQIRVQLSNIGCCIKGDLKYGAKRSNKDSSINLLAKKLEFIHPVSKELIKIVAPTPKDIIWKHCN